MAIDKTSEVWATGKAGEEAIRLWLMQRGWFVVPTADIDRGGAPMMEGLKFKAVLPDFMAAMNGKPAWVEIKTKSRPTFTLKTGRHEHGLKLSNWLDYMACQSQTGIPGYLCVYELESRKVLLASLDRLESVKRIYDGRNMPDRRPYIYFPRDAFDEHAGPEHGPAPLPPVNPRTPIGALL